MSITYKPAKMSGMSRKKAVRTLVSTVGSVNEPYNPVRNDAAKSLSHMLGDKTARMFGDALDELKSNPAQFSMVFKDKGLRMRALSAMSEKARVTEFPTSPDVVWDEFVQYMEYCEMFLVPPSLGTFAVWCGTSIDVFNRRIKEFKSSRPATSHALEVCKETIRAFLETKAVDGDIAPAVYLHQNKAYFDAIETTKVTHETITDTHVRDSEAIAEVIDLIPEEIKRQVESI